jgi:hypothetical protein
VIVELDRGGDEDAAPGRGASLPQESQRSKRATRRGRPARRLERGANDDVAEALHGGLEHLDEERVLRAEVGEEAALGEAELGREAGDGEAAEAIAAGHARRVLEDALPGLGAFAHG